MTLLPPFALLAWALAAAPQGGIDQPQPYVAARASSAGPEGSNTDFARVPPRTAFTVADLAGAGRIVHMWFTMSTAEKNYLSTTRVKIFWDGAATPAVDVPFGDFHLLGHGAVRQISSAFVTVEARPELNHNIPNKNVGGFNSYFPMPYGKGARIVVENTSELPINSLYYQIDYQKWPQAPSPMRFHAVYRRSAPAQRGAGPHVILEAKGRGHFVGVALSVDATAAGWWEGDETMWIDGERQPSIAGTGTEDYFGGAWGFRREYNTPYHGVAYLEKVPERKDWQAGRYSVYRFHAPDPVPFSRSIRVAIERGHNNQRSDSGYASVAFFYLRP